MTVYYATLTGQRYHTEGCESAGEHVEPVGLAEITMRQLTACGVCEPPTPTGAVMTPDTVNLTTLAKMVWEHVEAFDDAPGPAVHDHADGSASITGKGYAAIRADALTTAWIALVGLPMGDAMRYLKHLATTDSTPTRAALLPF